MSKHIRFRLLLDEMMPERKDFAQLNKYHNLRHINHDLHFPGIEDFQVITLAKETGRIIITKNIKHYRIECEREKVDMIGVSETTTPFNLDQKISAYLRKRKSTKMTGIYIHL